MKECWCCGRKFGFFGKMLSSPFSLKGLVLDVDDKVKCIFCGAINSWIVPAFVAFFLQMVCWIGYVVSFFMFMFLLPFRHGEELYNMLLMFSSLILFSFFYYKAFLFFLYSFRFLFSKKEPVN